jgi:stress response protein YsnF
MATTVIGVFETDSIGRVTQELVKAGFAKRDLDVIEGDEGEVVATVVDRGYGEDDARGYADAVRRGRKLLAASAPSDRVDEIVAIMERHEVDLDEEEEDGGDSEAAQTLPVVEEEVTAGKRKVARGGVRVTSSVEERPVRETVRLREEHVEATRRPVDRPLREDEAEDAFKDRMVEMTETAEELEVGREARVVEEVKLTKHAEEHEEKVKDTVRRTKVDVEEIGPSRRK